MADPSTTEGSPEPTEGALGTTRKEKRKALKKQKRKQIRREVAIKEREEDEARSNDPEEQLRTRLREEEEAAAVERERKAFEERERLWLEAAAAARRAQEEISAIAALKAEEDSERDKDNQLEQEKDLEDNDEWEYIEEGPAEIIWQGNEIIVKKKRVRVLKRTSDRETNKEDDDRPTSNPLPPQSATFTSHWDGQSAQEVFEDVAMQIPNFGTEQDKAHCPFHIKTGACRFGTRCSRVHFYPEKSCTLLIKNMYNGPGLAWEQDEGLEHTDEEIEGCYEEFYEDVHTEFLKFGELINFKVCKNGSFHLRGNVYAHYKSFESAILAFNAMNGRFFAGKQIMCEFVGVTRWKIAICGEYMKSRLRTCSRGTACNFIHCFRNPGGDYEWADWDSPPPKFWIKKMAVLFGPSVESVYNEHLNLEERERLRESSWKSKSTSYRHQSRTSTCDEMDTTHGGDSEREDSDGNRDDHRTHSRRRKHSSKWRSTNRYESYEENRKSESRSRSLRDRSCSHDSTKDNPKEQNMYILKQSRKGEEKNGSEGHERRKEKHKTEDRFRSSSHLRHRDRHNSTDWVADDADDYRERSNCPSGGHIDGHDRYDGRHYSPDTGSVEDSRDNVSEQSNPLHRRHHGSHDRVGYGKKLKYTVHYPMPEKFPPNESGDRWESTEIEEVDHHLLGNGSSRSSRKRSRSDGRKGGETSRKERTPPNRGSRR